MEKARITESELVLPSLYLMTLNPQGSISTSELIRLLTQILKPTGIDAEILENRKDTYFSQKVRNLKSHDTLTKYGYAKYSNGTYYITDRGRELVENNRVNIQYILSSGFEYNDVKTTLGHVYKSRTATVVHFDEIISEGNSKSVTTKSYERSAKLRNAAIEHFSHDGIIICDCCGFEFRSFYGEKYVTSCIEIHHMKPIFQYDSMDLNQTIEMALKNLLPVCPNCHRVIHKNNITADLIPQFKQQLNSESRKHSSIAI
jgi:predicted HNH restriction endonuclease